MSDTTADARTFYELLVAAATPTDLRHAAHVLTQGDTAHDLAKVLDVLADVIDGMGVFPALTTARAKEALELRRAGKAERLIVFAPGRSLRPPEGS